MFFQKLSEFSGKCTVFLKNLTEFSGAKYGKIGRSSVFAEERLEKANGRSAPR